MIVKVTDTFNRSLSTLGKDTQEAAKRLIERIITTGISQGMNLERLPLTPLWSIRPNRRYRIILHREDDSLVFLYIDQHDTAYRWAQQHRYRSDDIDDMTDNAIDPDK